MRKNKKNTPKIIKKKFDFFSFFTCILVVLVGIELVVGTAGITTLNAMLKGTPTLDVEQLYSQESTRIFDADGNQISDVGEQLRENMSYDEFPESLIDAFVSVEDSRFFKHNGFDPSRFIASIINTVRNGNTQGGSTFTMQLVKLTYFFVDTGNEETSVTSEKNVEYKVQQIAMALELEKQASKKEIFEMYLNKMNFGGSGNIRGVEKASEYYFNKRVTDLNLSESALLAGIINSPYYYDPMNYLDYSTQRRNVVLALMLRHGYITQEEYSLAKSINVEDLLYDHTTDTVESGNPYQAYIDAVLLEAEQITGQDPFTVAMDIHTAMNPEAQSLSDAICAGQYDDVWFPADQVELGFVTMNNQNGEVIAIGGGRNYSSNGGAGLLNHGTAVYHSPGSCVKPFMSYALAFENLGWATSHVVCDEPVGSREWIFSNFDGVYRGDVTLEYAIQTSLNTPAIAAMYEEFETMGYDNVAKYVESLDFSRYSYDMFDVAWAIGGNEFYASPEEIAQAHSMLINGGKLYKAHTIRTITYRSGTKDPITVSELEEYQPKQVLSPQAAYLSTYMMNKVVWSSEYNYAQILQRSYATYAKSGTSDYGDDAVQYGIPEGARKDKWMVCSTSEYTTAVWNGFDKADANVQSWFSDDWDSLNIPGRVCSAMLDQLNADHTPADVQQPDGISSITHIKGVYPYVSTIEGMDSEYVTTGLIKTEFNKLNSPQGADSVKDLTTFTASYSGNDQLLPSDGTLTLKWADYPDADKLKVADQEKDISLKYGDTVIRAATGKRMFDYSWVYGPIQYKARLEGSDGSSQELATDQSTYTQTVSLSPGVTYTVKGYYGYEKLGGNSNEVTAQVFTVPETIQIPVYTTSQEYKDWAEANGIKVDITESHGAKDTSVTYNNVDITGITVNKTVVQTGKINVVIPYQK